MAAGVLLRNLMMRTHLMVQRFWRNEKMITTNTVQLLLKLKKTRLKKGYKVESEPLSLKGGLLIYHMCGWCIIILYGDNVTLDFKWNYSGGELEKSEQVLGKEAAAAADKSSLSCKWDVGGMGWRLGRLLTKINSDRFGHKVRRTPVVLIMPRVTCLLLLVFVYRYIYIYSHCLNLYSPWILCCCSVRGLGYVSFCAPQLKMTC